MPDRKIQYFSEPEIDRLLSAILSVRDKAIFTTAYFHGLRASEVGLLQLSDYQPPRLYIHRLKDSESRHYPLAPEEDKAIRAWLRFRGVIPGPLFMSRFGRGIGRIQLHTLMKRYAGKAGLDPERSHFHVLRHSIAVHMGERRETAQTVKDWLGHASIGSTMVYLNVTDKGRDEAAERFYRGRSGPEKVKVNWAGEKRASAGRRKR